MIAGNVVAFPPFFKEANDGMIGGEAKQTTHLLFWTAVRHAGNARWIRGDDHRSDLRWYPLHWMVVRISLSHRTSPLAHGFYCHNTVTTAVFDARSGGTP
jgi:hypothetical protein